jgi:hypothetical protein
MDPFGLKVWASVKRPISAAQSMISLAFEEGFGFVQASEKGPSSPGSPDPASSSRRLIGKRRQEVSHRSGDSKPTSNLDWGAGQW